MKTVKDTQDNELLSTEGENMEDVNVEAVETELDENIYFVEFSKPYVFEGTSYTSLDLSKLESLTARQMIEVSKRANVGNKVNPELNMEYDLYIASKATDMPIEFFMGLPAKEAIKIKNRVIDFLFG